MLSEGRAHTTTQSTMTGSNYRSTVGGAFSALGTTLMGVGIVPQLAGAPSTPLLYIALAGFICTGLGQFFGTLFAADAKTLQALAERVDLHETALKTGDTSFLRKNDPPQTPNP